MWYAASFMAGLVLGPVILVAVLWLMRDVFPLVFVPSDWD